MALQSSQRLSELLFYTKKSYRILQLQFQLQSYKSIHIQPTHTHYTPENSPSRIQFYMQKTKSTSSTTTTFQRAKRPSFQKRYSTHRRQGDLLEIHPCVLQDIPGIPATRPSKGTPVITDIPVAPETFRTFQSFMTFQPLQAILQILQCSSISRESIPFQHSPIRMNILHILQFDWFPENSTEYQLGNYKHFYRHYILQRKGDVVISVKRASVDVKMTYFLE